MPEEQVDALPDAAAETLQSLGSADYQPATPDTQAVPASLPVNEVDGGTHASDPSFDYGLPAGVDTAPTSSTDPAAELSVPQAPVVDPTDGSSSGSADYR